MNKPLITIVFLALIALSVSVALSGQNLYSSVNRQTSSFQSEISVPVIDDKGEAQLIRAHVSLVPGRGQILLSLGESYIGDHQAQPAIKDAVLAAESATGIALGSRDVIISFSGRENTIEGSSLGAPLAIAVSQALRNDDSSGLATATGTVDRNGKIGSVGKIYEKAKAAKKEGLTKIIVPVNSSVEVSYSVKKTCADSGNCSRTIEKNIVDIEKEIGIDIIEVGNISAALIYFQ